MSLDGFTIGGVLFDLDNTLHDRDEAFVEWVRAFIADQLHVKDDGEARGLLDQIVRLDRGGAGSKPELFETIKDRTFA